MDNLTWLCPICAKEKVPYGTSPCKLKNCVHKPCSTGTWYVQQDKDRCELEAYGDIFKDIEVIGVGISEIANSEE